MDELLSLANAYYTVAADIERRAHEMLHIAEVLKTAADRTCEENMRQKSKSPDSAGESHE